MLTIFETGGGNLLNMVSFLTDVDITLCMFELDLSFNLPTASIIHTVSHSVANISLATRNVCLKFHCL